MRSSSSVAFGLWALLLVPAVLGASAPILRSAVFLPDGSAVVLTFDTPTNRGQQTGAWPCSNVFQVVGITQHCTWINSTAAMMYTGQLSTVVPGNTVVLLPGILKSEDGTSGWSSGSTTLKTPPNPVAPSATVTGPSSFSSGCLLGGLTLDSNTVGIRLTYVWTVKGGLLSLPVALVSLLATLTTPSVTVPLLLFPLGSTTFQLQVTNFLGVRGAPALFTVTRQATGLNPVITIENTPQPLAVYRHLPTMLTARVHTSPCANARAVRPSWQVTSGGPLPSALGYNTTELYLPPYSLARDASYTFRFTVVDVAIPSLTASATITVNTVRPDPVAVITGADRIVGYNEAFSVDMLASVDFEQAGLTSTWTCVNSATGAACVNALSNPPAAIVFTNRQSIAFPAGTLTPGWYRFTLRVTTPGTTPSVATAWLTVSPSPAVTISIATLPVPINPSLRLVISATATSPIGAPITYVNWTILEGDLAPDAAITGFLGMQLAIEADALVPGQQYRLRFFASDGATTSYADVAFVPLVAPTGGIIDGPLTVTAATDAFNLKTIGWASGDGSTTGLSYRFTYMHPVTSVEYPLSMFLPSNVATDMYFPNLGAMPVTVRITAYAVNRLGVVNSVGRTMLVNPPGSNVLGALLGAVLGTLLNLDVSRLLLNVAVQASLGVDSVDQQNDLLAAIGTALDGVAIIRHDVADIAFTALALTAETMLPLEDQQQQALAELRRTVAPFAVQGSANARRKRSLPVSLQTSVISPALSVLSVRTVAAVFESGTLPLQPTPDTLGVSIKSSLEALADAHLLGRVCEEPLATSVTSGLQLATGLQPAGKLFQSNIVLPKGRWSIPRSFYERPLLADLACIPIKAFILPNNIRTGMAVNNIFSSACQPLTCADFDNANCGSPRDGCGGTLSCGSCAAGFTCGSTFRCVPGSASTLARRTVTEPAPTPAPVAKRQASASAYDPYAFDGWSVAGSIMYLTVGPGGNDVSPGAGRRPFNYTDGVVIDIPLPAGTSAASGFRCVYKEQLGAPWRSDSTCVLTGSNATHARCTCYHLSAVTVQSSEGKCRPRQCWDIMFGSLWNDCSWSPCNQPYPNWFAGNMMCTLFSDGCGGLISCGSCGVGTNYLQACTRDGCVAAGQSQGSAAAAPAPYVDACGDQCGYVQFSNGGSTVCSCPAGKACVSGRCTACSKSCQALGKTCGTWVGDNGAVVGPCGDCPQGQKCTSNGTCAGDMMMAAATSCQPTYDSCPPGRCGPINNGCGQMLACGGCPGAQTCSTDGFCKQKCLTCWDIVWKSLRNDTCPCRGDGMEPYMSAGSLQCSNYYDGCGGIITCGTCNGMIDGRIVTPMDCVPGYGCVDPANNYVAIGCVQDCGDTCGLTYFTDCGSKMCTCAAGKICYKGRCIVPDNYALDISNGSSYIGFASVGSSKLNSFTFQSWVLVSPALPWRDQYLFSNGITDQDGFFVKIPKTVTQPQDSRLGVYIVGPTPPYNTVANYKLPVAQWTYLTMTMVAINSTLQSWTIFENGEQKTTFTVSGPLRPPSQRFCIGGSPAAGTSGNAGNFAGMFDDVQIWEIALTANQIAWTMKYWMTGFEGGLALYLPFNEGNGTVTAPAGTGASKGVLTSAIMKTPAPFQWTVRTGANLVSPPAGASFPASMESDPTSSGVLSLPAQSGEPSAAGMVIAIASLAGVALAAFALVASWRIYRSRKRVAPVVFVSDDTATSCDAPSTDASCKDAALADETPRRPLVTEASLDSIE
eukprot:TRINITY_DN293_c0_g1_i4.p1 TRINITY_DN293_c0_g1~~TRINITY_DN293_c0_g1_i4.p1  ORF type:complete len:1750 (+),score=421.76 TRINITY_DN293_c0_g1_i4:163-5412(+)